MKLGSSLFFFKMNSEMSISEPVSEEQMRVLVKQCKENIDLTQHLLYSKKWELRSLQVETNLFRYDNKWKPQHRKLFAEGTEDGKRKNRPLNKQGWVLPLKKLCDKVGIAILISSIVVLIKLKYEWKLNEVKQIEGQITQQK